jgi:hypothetical protein
MKITDSEYEEFTKLTENLSDCIDALVAEVIKPGLSFSGRLRAAERMNVKVRRCLSKVCWYILLNQEK